MKITLRLMAAIIVLSSCSILSAHTVAVDEL